MPTLTEITRLFGTYGNIAFGGGNPTMAVLQREIIERRKWLGVNDVGVAYGLARVTPGTNLLAFCAATGWLLRGVPGATLALLAASLPCSTAATLITALYELWSGNRVLQAALGGAMAGAVAVMAAAGWTLVRPYLRLVPRLQAALLVVGSFVLGILLVAPLRVLVAAAVIGVFWPPRKQNP
jgi:chromate transporter